MKLQSLLDSESKDATIQLRLGFFFIGQGYQTGRKILLKSL